MPTSMRAALRERVDLPSLALLFAFVTGVTVAFGFGPRTAALMFGGGLAAVLLDAAIHAGRVHRQTGRAAIGVVVVAAGLRLASEGGWSTNAVLFVAVPFTLGGSWTVLDAIVSLRQGVVESDGSVGGVPDVPALVANADTAGRVYAVLEAADRPLSAEAVADLAELDPDWTRRLLALLVTRGVVTRVGEREPAGYVGREVPADESTVALVVRGTVARLVQPFRLLAGGAAASRQA